MILTSIPISILSFVLRHASFVNPISSFRSSGDHGRIYVHLDSYVFMAHVSQRVAITLRTALVINTHYV